MFQKNQQIGIYTLIEKIGRGGFGEVWLAERRSELVTKTVAVKLPHDEQVKIEAIKQEAELWEQASGHANVLPIIDADIYDGQIVIVSEYAEGGSLHDRLRRDGKFPTEKAVEMVIGILNGLEFLHNRRIIHRDVKPQNILLQGDTPRLADFGISRAMQTTAVSSKIVGTDSYMAPESFSGQRSVQTDVWSVGVVFYQLLCGRLPFPQEHPAERMFSILQEEIVPLPEDTPEQLIAIVNRSLTKLPENRYQSATAMQEDLHQFLYGKPTEAEYQSEVTRVIPSNLPPPINTPQAPVSDSTNPQSPTRQNTQQDKTRQYQASKAASIRIPINKEEPQTATQNLKSAPQTEAEVTSGGSKTMFLKSLLAGGLLGGLIIGLVGVALFSMTNSGDRVGLTGGNSNNNESSTSGKSESDSSKTDGDKSENPLTIENDLTKDKATSISPEDDRLKDSSTPETPKETQTPTKTPTPKPTPTPTPRLGKTVKVTVIITAETRNLDDRVPGASVRISSKGKTYSAKSNSRGIAAFGKIPCGQTAKISISFGYEKGNFTRNVRCGGRQSWSYSIGIMGGIDQER